MATKQQKSYIPDRRQILSISCNVVYRPRPDRESILDVVQEGRSLKLGVSWRARLIVPTCNNSKHLAYMSLLRVSRNTGVKETKITGTGDQSSTLLGVRLDWSSHVPTENVSWMLFKRDMADIQQQLTGSLTW